MEAAAAAKGGVVRKDPAVGLKIIMHFISRGHPLVLSQGEWAMQNCAPQSQPPEHVKQAQIHYWFHPVIGLEQAPFSAVV